MTAAEFSGGIKAFPNDPAFTSEFTFLSTDPGIIRISLSVEQRQRLQRSPGLYQIRRTAQAVAPATPLPQVVLQGQFTDRFILQDSECYRATDSVHYGICTFAVFRADCGLMVDSPTSPVPVSSCPQPTASPTVGVEVLGAIAGTSATSTAVHLNEIIGIDSAVAGTDYNAALAAGAYVNPLAPTVAELQAVINAVNAANAGGGTNDPEPSPEPATVTTILTDGQTAFTLSRTPPDVTLVEFYVNGQKQRINDDFTVVGTTVTWVSTDFLLTVTDEIQIRF